LDLRGHGTSHDPALDLGVARFGMDIPHVMRALGIPKAVLVGFSVGANSVLHLAARQPSLVHAIVAIGASAKGDPGRVKNILTGPWPRELRGLDHTAARGDPNHWQHLRSALARDWGEHLDFLATGLDTVTAPTWIVHGEDDPIVHPEQAQMLASALPNSRLVMVPDAGHQVHREQPEAFMRVLDEVVDTVEGAHQSSFRS
jgi:pimeloyl-ACP methyl ester carboxylesterase